jgi:hypothetical protein
LLLWLWAQMLKVETGAEAADALVVELCVADD